MPAQLYVMIAAIAIVLLIFVELIQLQKKKKNSAAEEAKTTESAASDDDFEVGNAKQRKAKNATDTKKSKVAKLSGNPSSKKPTLIVGAKKEMPREDATQNGPVENVMDEILEQALTNSGYTDPADDIKESPKEAPVKLNISKMSNENPVKLNLSNNYRGSANESFPEVAQSGKPEIKMDSEPPVHQTRTRKKLVSETQVEQKDDQIIGMNFDAGGLRDFESPSVDDIFGDSMLTDENYKNMLFDKLEEPEITSGDTTVIGMQEIKEDKPQSASEEEVEPITDLDDLLDKPEKVEEPVQTEDAAEPVEDDLAEEQTEESVEDVAQEDEPVEPVKEQPEPIEEQHSVEEVKTVSNNRLVNMFPSEINVNSPSDDVVIQFESTSVKRPVQKDGVIYLYNSHVYRNSNTLPWDIRFEVQLHEGEELTVDTGIGIRVPEGFGIRLIPSNDLAEKFGLRLSSSEVLSRAEAAYSIKFRVKAINPMAYIAKNQSLVSVQIFRI